MRLIIEGDCYKSVLFFEKWSDAATYLEKLEKKKPVDWYIEK